MKYGLNTPAGGGFPITSHNTNELKAVTKGLYVGTGGDLRVKLLDGSTVTLKAVPGGSYHPLQVRQVYTTGTSAGDIVGLL